MAVNAESVVESISVNIDSAMAMLETSRVKSGWVSRNQLTIARKRINDALALMDVLESLEQ